MSLAFQSTPPVKAATPDAAFQIGWRKFQSTPPVKAATYFSNPYSEYRYISIHAAREGGDDAVRGVLEYISNFNPRRP